MQNREKISFPAFVACHKKVFIAVVVLLVVVVCAISIPIACANHWCFTYHYDEVTHEFTLRYIGLEEREISVQIGTHDFIIYSFSPANREIKMDNVVPSQYGSLCSAFDYTLPQGKSHFFILKFDPNTSKLCPYWYDDIWKLRE